MTTKMVSKEGGGSGFWDDEDWDVLNAASKEKSATAIHNDLDPPGWKVENQYGSNMSNQHLTSSIYTLQQQQEQEPQSSLMSISAEQQGYVSDLTLPSNRSLTTATTATVATDGSSRSSLNGYFQSQRGGMKNNLRPTPEVADAESVPPTPLSPSMTKTPTTSASRRKSVMDIVKNILSPTAGSSKKRQERRRMRSSSTGAGRRFRPKATSTNDKEQMGNGDVDDDSSTQRRVRSSSAGAGRRFRYPSSLHQQQQYDDENNLDTTTDPNQPQNVALTNNGDPLWDGTPHRSSSLSNLQATEGLTKSPRPARRASIGVTCYGVGVSSSSLIAGGPDPTLRDPVLARQRRKILKEQSKSSRLLLSSTPEPMSDQLQSYPKSAHNVPTPSPAGSGNDETSNVPLPLVEQDGAGWTKSPAAGPTTTILRLNDESDPQTSSRHNRHHSSTEIDRNYYPDSVRGNRSSSVDASTRHLGETKIDPPATTHAGTTDHSKKKRRKEKSKNSASTRTRNSSRGRSRKTRSTSPTKFNQELSQRHATRDEQTPTSMRRSRSNGDIGSDILDNQLHGNEEMAISAEALIQNILDGKLAMKRSTSRGGSRRQRSTSPKVSETKKLSKGNSIDKMIKQDTEYAKTTLVLNDEVTTTSRSRRSRRSSSRGASRDRRKRSTSISSTGSRRSKKKSDTSISTRTQSSSDNRSRRKIRSSSPTLIPDGEESAQQVDGASNQHSLSSHRKKTRATTKVASAADIDGGDNSVVDDEYPEALKRQHSQKQLSGSSSKKLLMVRAKSMSRLNQSSSAQPASSSMTSANKKDELRRSRSSSNMGHSSDSVSDDKSRRRRLKKQPAASTNSIDRLEKEEKGEEVDGNGSMNDWGYTSLSHIKRTEALHTSNDSSLDASMWSFSNAGDSNNAYEDWDVIKKSYKVPNITKAQNLCKAMDKKFNSEDGETAVNIGAGSMKLSRRQHSSRTLSSSRSRRDKKGRSKESGHIDVDVSTSTVRRARVKDALSRHGINNSFGNDTALSLNEIDPSGGGEVSFLNRIPTIRRDNTTRAKGETFDLEMNETKTITRLPQLQRDKTI